MVERDLRVNEIIEGGGERRGWERGRQRGKESDRSREEETLKERKGVIVQGDWNNASALQGESDSNRQRKGLIYDSRRWNREEKKRKDTVPGRRYRQRKGLTQTAMGREEEPEGVPLQSPRDGKDRVARSRGQTVLRRAWLQIQWLEKNQLGVPLWVLLCSCVLTSKWA